MRQRACVWMVSLTCIVGCADTRSQAAHLEERDTIGDTLVVHTTAGSVWGGTALLEDLITIGVSNGDENYIFGNVTEVVDDGNGGAYVFDQHVPAIRHYSSDGAYIRTIGREGSGPGEYGDAVLGLAIRRDGTLLAYDIRNSRINLYTKTGTPTGQWNVAGGLFASSAMMVDSLDRVYVKVLAARDATKLLRWPWPIGLLRLDSLGAVLDTIPPPRFGNVAKRGSGPLSTAEVWQTTPDFTVIGVNSSYSFEIRRPSGKVVRVSKAFEPVAIGDDEWQAFEARRSWDIANDPEEDTPPPTPRTKPVYKGFYVDSTGRVWVDKFIPAIPAPPDTMGTPADAPPTFPFVEQVGFDVFDDEGRFLGSVQVPPRTRLHWIGADYAWGIRLGENDEQVIVKLRLTMPQTSGR